MAITTRNFERERDPTIGREITVMITSCPPKFNGEMGENGVAEKTLMETVDRMAIAKSN
jgi:hypothetical protein